jgi:hypothetical protein
LDQGLVDIFEFLRRKRVGQALDNVTNLVNPDMGRGKARRICIIGGSKYKNLKLKREREEGPKAKSK